MGGRLEPPYKLYIISDENTSNNVKEIYCSKTDLSWDRSQENVQTETNIIISTENVNTNISSDNNYLQSTNVQLEKILQRFVTVELFETIYNDYIVCKHYIKVILENVKVYGNISSQFTEINEKIYQSKIKLLEENVEKLKLKIKV